MVAADRCGREAQRHAVVVGPGLVRRAGRRGTAVADARDVRIGQDLARLGLAREDGAVDVALPVPRAARLAAVPVAGRVGAKLPLGPACVEILALTSRWRERYSKGRRIRPVRQHWRGGGGGAVVGGRAIAPDMTALVTFGLRGSTIIRVLRDRLTIDAATCGFGIKAAVRSRRAREGRQDGEGQPHLAWTLALNSDHGAQAHGQRGAAPCAAQGRGQVLRTLRDQLSRRRNPHARIAAAGALAAAHPAARRTTSAAASLPCLEIQTQISNPRCQNSRSATRARGHTN